MLSESDPFGQGRSVLSNKELYATTYQNWSRIMLRLPSIPDQYVYPYDGPDDDDREPPEGGDAWLPLFNAARDQKSAVYVLDEEALRENLIKVVYLDIHGNTVWLHKMHPENINAFEARGSCSGAPLETSMEFADSDESLLQSGAIMSYDG